MYWIHVSLWPNWKNLGSGFLARWQLTSHALYYKIPYSLLDWLGFLLINHSFIHAQQRFAFLCYSWNRVCRVPRFRCVKHPIVVWIPLGQDIFYQHYFVYYPWELFIWCYLWSRIFFILKLCQCTIWHRNKSGKWSCRYYILRT